MQEELQGRPSKNNRNRDSRERERKSAKKVLEKAPPESSAP